MQQPNPVPKQMTTKQAADYLSLSPHTLNQWRSLGKGPRFVRLGGAVRYPKTFLDSYLQASERRSTFG